MEQLERDALIKQLLFIFAMAGSLLVLTHFSVLGLLNQKIKEARENH